VDGLLAGSSLDLAIEVYWHALAQLGIAEFLAQRTIDMSKMVIIVPK